MGFTGDSIIIRGDFSFDRIENLKEGDYLFNPETKKQSKIKRIETFYSENGFLIKTENFFPINLSEDTLVKNSSLSIVDGNFYLNNQTYLVPNDLNKVSFLTIPKITNEEDQLFPELFLYSKLLLKGSYDKENQKIIFNNYSDKFNAYKQETNFTNINFLNNKNLKRIFINNVNNDNLEWINDLEKKTSQRNLNAKIFNMSDEEIHRFLQEFLKENSEYYLNDKNFRVYTQSKIIATQLLYLIIGYTEDFPNIEQIKKDLWNYKEIKGSNKKNKFSITCHEDLRSVIFKEGYYYQQLKFFQKNQRNLKYYKIITENNEPFIVYNLVIKEKE